MRCFITGVTGYIGRHLARHLRENGHDVKAVVRRRERTGADPAQELTASGVEVIEGDLLDERLIGEAVAGAEVVFHLAWQTNRPSLPHVSGGTGEDQWRANVGGMQNLITASKSAGIRRFIFTSTVAIYGKWTQVQEIARASRRDSNALNVAGGPPLREEDAIKSAEGMRAGGMRDYVAPKIAAEKMLMEQLPKPDYLTLRLSIVYGPLAPGTVETVRHAVLGQRPFGDAQAVQRIHVEDAVKSLMLAANRPEAANKTMNIAGNETVGSGDYMEALRQIAAWIQQGRPREGHHASFALLPMRYDMTQARQYLGFQSSVPLMDGLEEMVEAALPNIALPIGFAPGSRFGGGGWERRPRASGQWARRGVRGRFGKGFWA